MLRAAAEHDTLRVRDTDIGFPKGFGFRNTESLGPQLVGMMTERLGGRLTLTCEGGTTFAVSIPYGTREVKEDAHAPGPDSDRGR
jgi:two-component sensor histidine kinase